MHKFVLFWPVDGLLEPKHFVKFLKYGQVADIYVVFLDGNKISLYYYNTTGWLLLKKEPYLYFFTFTTFIRYIFFSDAYLANYGPDAHGNTSYVSSIPVRCQSLLKSVDTWNT
jgi:hypothetical protein